MVPENQKRAAKTKMIGNGKKRPPLVAERRVAAKAADPARKKQSKARRTRARSQHSNPVVRLIAGLVGFVTRIIWGVTWRFTLVVLLLVGGASAWFAAQLPPVSELTDGRSRGSVTMLDREGEVYAWRGEQFGGQITPDTASPHLVNAVLATEDKRFYRHLGISPRGIASAIRINLSEGRGPLSGNGGSTITQQTAKLLCLGVPYDAAVWDTQEAYEADCRRTTLWRKAKEALFSIGMEMRYSKDEILTIYLNRVYLGASAQGFEAASQRYFGKSANEVTPPEAAMLAGLLKAPSVYAPTANLERSRDRANLIVGLMEDQGYLTADEADRARNNPARLSEAASASAGGYFADWVMESGPEYLTRDTTEDVIIRTTLDQRMQKDAEEALDFIFRTKVSDASEAQAAIVVMSADGAVRAMVGGRNSQGGGTFNRATQALRQTGSSFKPFVYAALLDQGHSPESTVADDNWCTNVPGSGDYCPQNYDRRFMGRMSFTDALMLSRNVPAVKAALSAGLDNVRTVAEQFGIESDLAAGPALALGSSESTLLEMTGAYAGFLNGGSSVKPYGLIELSLRDDPTPMMGQGGGMGERVIMEESARQLVYMMNKVITSGTGTRAQLPDREAAGKTGTTSAARDAWFIGFTADYVAGVWMGYDDNTPLKGVTGGGLPAEIWQEVMMRIHQGVPPRPLPMMQPQESTFVAESYPENGEVPDNYVAPRDTQRQPRRQRRDDGDVVERVLIDVLNGLFGR